MKHVQVEQHISFEYKHIIDISWYIHIYYHIWASLCSYDPHLVSRICSSRMPIGYQDLQRNMYLYCRCFKTWICSRCLEKVKHILPNGGWKVIYHGTKLKHDLKQIVFSYPFRDHRIVHTLQLPNFKTTKKAHASMPPFSGSPTTIVMTSQGAFWPQRCKQTH